MYNPKAFQQLDQDILLQAIGNTGLATLVTMGDNGLEASHVPLILSPDNLCLYGHLAHANAQWKMFNPAIPALAIFTGPDFYVTPSWYPSKQETGKVVPTWNYIAVHVTGIIEFIDDSAQKLQILSQLTDRHESPRPHPWALSDAPTDYVDAQLKAIIAFKLTIKDIQGKWKLSQNRTPADRQGVIDGLRREGLDDLADLM